ncbi:MAG: rod shape-determining protein [Candidatus Tagabacteria bacterium RIFCSPLOWO2_01_FULL_39_11]|uniref:Cell shape-determining protein MreB n=1 Tax=Candidatus Tagabacteria bacterium RIFCSPLOWO2_01_FULL_39_11 TaxID=1802295 RepID=A0A1G2LN06_9BACT|nr:MAG: rod shape-determining protein [Candidatus Tagabacteria bacterium RIFCSPLOWO2_01_FULL_39_11]
MFNRFFSFFSHDIGIDLGTANTLVYVKGKGIVVNEPSIVAINQKTGQVVAVGQEAKMMVGRTPSHIVASQPLKEGVISDFEVTEEMIAYFIRNAHKDKSIFSARPKIVIGVPSGITEVERRAVRDAARNAGAGKVFLVEEPLAAAIGIKLPISDPVGNMIIDIGGGTTDIAVISLGGIVSSKNLRIAGDKFNQDIINYLRDEFKILLGEKTAEDVKIAIGNVWKQNSDMTEATVRGRDLITGLPREVVITDADIRDAISKSIDVIVESTKEVIEETPPELISDIMYRGIFIVGGGSFLKGIDKLINHETKMPVFVAEDPLTAVVRGTGIILECVEKYKDMFVEYGEEIPPQ